MLAGSIANCATAIVFSAVYSIVLDPFPHGNAQHLLNMRIEQDGPGVPQMGFPAAQFLDVAHGTNAFPVC